MKQRTLYMHTLNGRPAYYETGRQIVYAGKHVRRLCASLRQIHDEQAKDRAWRIRQSYRDYGEDYGYARVSVESVR